MYRIDNKRAAILHVQSMLRALSYNESAYTHNPKDGIYGSETEDNVKRLQTDVGLTPSGRVDHATFVALRDSNRAHPTHRTSPISMLSRGMQGEDVSALHAMLKKFHRLHPTMLTPPTGSYYSSESEDAVRALERFFQMEEDGCMSEELLGCLTAYLDAYSKTEG